MGTRRKISPAVKSLLNEAELAAERKAEYATYEDLYTVSQSGNPAGSGKR